MMGDSNKLEIIYRERITEKSIEYYTKSPNGHNRIKMFIEPLDEITMTLIRDAEVQGNQDATERAKILSEKAAWNPKEARRIWDVHNESVLINGTYGLQRLDRIKDHACRAFRDWLTGGLLCQEPVDGVKCTFTDATVHADPVHTDFNEIKGMMFSGLSLCFLSAKPRLFEPIHNIEIAIPRGTEDTISSILTAHRGLIVTMNREGPSSFIKCDLPAAEETAVAESIQDECPGQVTYTWTFAGFQPLPPALQEETIMAIRNRKGAPAPPPLP